MTIINKKKLIFVRKKRPMNKKLIFFTCIIFFSIISVSSLFYIKSQKPPAISDLATIEFYSADNTKFFELNNNKDQTYVTLQNISPYMIDAIISIEDKHFYEHSGFDYRRIIKSLTDNVLAMKKKYGASTITQQYARNLYLNHEKSYKRKIKEAYYTILLENNYSKNEILEGYLNTIYFGHGIYGVSDAAMYYFNKPIADISIAEACVLASIIKAPTYYSPIANLKRNTERKELILSQMYKQNKITKEEYNKALEEKISVIGKHPRSKENIAPYYQDILVSQLTKFDLDRDKFFKGIKVYTTLDLNLNDIIKNTINDIYSPYSYIETAVYAIDPQTGFVKAVVGGRDYQNSQYNRATVGMRHLGSTIKPLLYYSALEYGFTPTTTFKSAETTFYINNGLEKYSPSNYANLYANKDITMAYALAVSDNIYAVKTHLFLGEETLVKTAKRFGITADLKPVPSLALGASEIKLSEMTTAYAHFANLGDRVTPVYITKITDINDNIIYQHQPVITQVLSKDLCFLMNHMLNGIFDTRMSDYVSVTGLSIAHQLTHKYAGKSGSTDFDNTMIGYNPYLALGVWTGYDEQIPLTNYQEKTYSKKVWANVMEKYFQSVDTPWFTQSTNIVGVLVNPITGNLATPNDPYTKIIYYIKGTQPPYRN